MHEEFDCQDELVLANSLTQTYKQTVIAEIAQVIQVVLRAATNAFRSPCSQQAMREHSWHIQLQQM